MAILIILLIFAVLLCISWIGTCGIIWLITLCFGLTFSWPIATGIWLILCLISGGIKITVKKEK